MDIAGLPDFRQLISKGGRSIWQTQAFVQLAEFPAAGVNAFRLSFVLWSESRIGIRHEEEK